MIDAIKHCKHEHGRDANPTEKKRKTKSATTHDLLFGATRADGPRLTHKDIGRLRKLRKQVMARNANHNARGTRKHTGICIDSGATITLLMATARGAASKEEHVNPRPFQAFGLWKATSPGVLGGGFSDSALKTARFLCLNTTH